MQRENYILHEIFLFNEKYKQNIARRLNPDIKESTILEIAIVYTYIFFFILCVKLRYASLKYRYTFFKHCTTPCQKTRI